MRVIWAGVLVLLPLLAEYATAQRCRGQPDAPEFASIRCFRKRNTCRATCQSGYIFTQKDAKFAAYDCQGGEWVMKGGEETRCDPYCDPPCKNGDCVEPDVCECDEGFTGDLCDEEEEEYLEPEADPEPYEEEDYYSEEATRNLRGATGRAAPKSGDNATDDTIKEIPPYITAMFNTVITNLMDREDNAREQLKEYFQSELAKKDAIISDLSKKVRANTFSLDSLNQYTRSENIKIHGVEYKKGEDTNQILKDVGKYCGVDIKDSDISVSHRLMSKEEMDRQINPSNKDMKIPVIIGRVNRRDVKTKLLEARKTITTNPHCPEHLKKVIMYEDVTPLKSRIMYQLRQRNDKKAFRYVWSKGGRIYARTHEDADKPREQQDKPYIINTPDDLVKTGFSEDEIENIIYNVRP